MTESAQPIAVVLMALGGPDCLDNVEPYLLDIRGGRPTPPELVAEIRERYRATGGKSPVLDITRDIVRLLERRLNATREKSPHPYLVYFGFRHWHPFIQETYKTLMQDPPSQVIGVCLAPQYSSLSVGAYVKKVEEAKEALGGDFPISYVKSWNRHPLLIKAIAANVEVGLRKFSSEHRERVPIIFTAHSLPERILNMNDPYPDEVRGTMEALCDQLSPRPFHFAYQSQGRSGEKWLGPTVEDTLETLHKEGHRQVLIAPIGFLSDHLEVLYDVDIEFKQLAQSKGMQLERIPMLNASVPLIETLAAVIENHLTSCPSSVMPS